MLTSPGGACDPCLAGDRLYFMEVLTQLHDSTNRLAKAMGQLASTRTLPNLRKAGLPTEVSYLISQPKPKPKPKHVASHHITSHHITLYITSTSRRKA